MTATANRPKPAVTAAAAPTGMLSSYVDKIRGGDIGALPAITGLVVLCVVFSILRPSFFSPGNFANLIPQGAAVSVIAMGLVFVLLTGEIDLSAGFASGVCAAVLAIGLTSFGLPWYLAAGAAIATGSLLGLILGLFVAKVGIPSFVVTLAAFLAFQGVVLLLVEEGTNISIRNDVIVAINNQNLPPWLGWALAVLAVAGFAATQLARRQGRLRRGLTCQPLTAVGFKVAGLAVLLGVPVFVLNLERSRDVTITSLKGVPIVVPVIAVILVVGAFVLNRTVFGRHLYAVGGNREAARRAGINVDRTRILAFVICSSLAAVGGILAASKATSVDANTGGSDVLLLAVGSAVIGGTSLFGGKGRIQDALLGGMVIAVIINGMGLMGLGASMKYVVTGSVLLLAAGVDVLSRKRAAATGSL